MIDLMAAFEQREGRVAVDTQLLAEGAGGFVPFGDGLGIAAVFNRLNGTGLHAGVMNFPGQSPTQNLFPQYMQPGSISLANSSCVTTQFGATVLLGDKLLAAGGHDPNGTAEEVCVFDTTSMKFIRFGTTRSCAQSHCKLNILLIPCCVLVDAARTQSCPLRIVLGSLLRPALP